MASEESTTDGRARALVVLALIAAGTTAAACGDANGAGGSRGAETISPNTGGTPLEPIAFFEERAEAAGVDFRMRFLPEEQGQNFKINLYDHGCGVVVGDIDGDDDDDLLFLNQLGPNALYRNRGDGTFDDVTATAGVALADRICVAGTFGDYDADGDLDLYVTSTRGGNVLLRNRGNGTFEDMSSAAGVHHVGHSQGALFFDYDGDGNLDLFVTNTAAWTTNTYDEGARYFRGKESLFELVDSTPEENILFRNRGDGTFEDVTRRVGLDGTSWGGDFAAFDYDDDGDTDLFVTNMFGASRLYRNDCGEAAGGGGFVNVRNEALGKTSWGTIGARVFDLDTDGRLDLALADMHSDMWMPLDYPAKLVEPQRKYSGFLGRSAELYPDLAEHDEALFAEKFDIDYAKAVFGNTLFRNLGSGRFEEVSGPAGFETFWPWGIASGDFDNDGNEDLFLPSGMGYPFVYWPSALLINTGDAKLVDRIHGSGLDYGPEERFHGELIGGERAPRSSRCAATADLDGDGRLDLILNNFNDRAGIYMNTSPQRNYLAVRLHGAGKNRDALGATVNIVAAGGKQIRLSQSAGGYLSQSSMTLHFGLGDASQVQRLDVRWPSGGTTTLRDIDANQTLDITEPGADDDTGE